MWEPSGACISKTHKSGPPGPPWLGPLKCLTLRLVHTEPPAVHELQLRSSCSCTGSRGGCCSGKWWFSVLTYLSIQFGGKPFALRPHFSYRSKKSCWFSSLCSFFLLVRGGVIQAFYMLSWEPEVWVQLLKSAYVAVPGLQCGGEEEDMHCIISLSLVIIAVLFKWWKIFQVISLCLGIREKGTIGTILTWYWKLPSSSECCHEPILQWSFVQHRIKLAGGTTFIHS